jgi:alpha,alpha-trehalose phosphorylase
VIEHPDFYEIDPWSVRESRLDLSILAQTESIFALSNGHIGLRGNLDEGEPHGMPGTYLNAFYEIQLLPYAEPGYGYADTGQTLVNVANGKIVRLLVDDQPFDVRYGRLRSHRRILDLRAGYLRREAEWESPAGRVIRVASTRLVSLAQRAIAAIEYEVEPLDGRARLVVQSELVANEPLPPQMDRDPRIAPAIPSPLQSEYVAEHGSRVVLVHATRNSGLHSAAAMDHWLEGPGELRAETESGPDLGRVTVAAELNPGQRLRLVKFLAYGWSRQRSVPALRDQVEAALAAARQTGWDGLLREQWEYLDAFWRSADVEVSGDDELQQALRFALFHTFQSAARGENRPIPAKGLTGPGYGGHSFWDMDTFVLHALTYTAPQTVASALRWRHSTLSFARQRAQQLGLEGAMFPWRTIRGQELSAYWPAGAAAVHINADIADAVVRYSRATEDEEFERDYGVELLVETARLWRSLGSYDAKRRFNIDGVTGPDEYSALADNNVYTNLMAQRNLRAAAEAAERFPERARELRVTADEIRAWKEAAKAMWIRFDRMLGVYSQDERFTHYARWDFERTRPDQYPLFLHFPYFQLYRKQVVKQADLVLALHLRGDAFSDEEKRRAFDYYEGLTVRDSSLSAGTQAIVAAEVGHIDLAYDYLAESALIDLHDVEHNVRDGLHIGALAASWLATVAGFGGMRDSDGDLSFAPRLPPGLSRLAFRIVYRGRRLSVEIDPANATYRLLEGEPIAIRHHRIELRLGRDPVSVAIPPLVPVPRPSQPKGRVPERRVPATGPDQGR